MVDANRSSSDEGGAEGQQLMRRRGAELVACEAFGRWYSQAGTPTLTVKILQQAGARRAGSVAVELRQETAPTAGQPSKANPWPRRARERVPPKVLSD